ncbi:MAG: LD-carboxypeptidase [Saprospiraceae bacterium]
MKRRAFLIKSGAAALAGLFSFHQSPAQPLLHNMTKSRLIKPAPLRKGAVVGLIAPASPPAPEKFDKAFANLAALGFNVKCGAHLRDRLGHLAGTDDDRLADLHWAFSDPEVEVVWCIRGGYGCSRLLPGIDFDLIRKHPKPFIGYSDVTALHLAISQRTGLVTFHGTVAAGDFPEPTLAHFQATLMQGSATHTIEAPKGPFESPEYQPFVITSGRATGRLTGGNLALLSALAGTPFEPEFRDKLVFIEDVGEQPYRVDRMLTQLLQATDLKHAAAIALGVFADCAPKPDTASLTLEETLRDRLGHLGIPVMYGIPFGHVAYQAVFPYGIRAELDTDAQTLTLLENAVG